MERGGDVAAIVYDTTGKTLRQGYCYTCLAMGGGVFRSGHEAQLSQSKISPPTTLGALSRKNARKFPTSIGGRLLVCIGRCLRDSVKTLQSAKFSATAWLPDRRGCSPCHKEVLQKGDQKSSQNQESPRQTKPKKGQLMNLPEQKFDVNRACFFKEKHQTSQKWAKFMNFSFWPFLWFGLLGRLLTKASESDQKRKMIELLLSTCFCRILTFEMGLFSNLTLEDNSQSRTYLKGRARERNRKR